MSNFRRPTDTRTAAEAAFRKVTSPKADGPVVLRSAPGARELVTLRVDSDVLEFYQAEGAGWQDRVNAALRKAAGL